MPQMSPLMWTTLFFFFVSTLFIYLSINYFIKQYSPKMKTTFKNKALIHWKW